MIIRRSYYSIMFMLSVIFFLACSDQGAISHRIQSPSEPSKGIELARSQQFPIQILSLGRVNPASDRTLEGGMEYLWKPAHDEGQPPPYWNKDWNWGLRAAPKNLLKYIIDSSISLL